MIEQPKIYLVFGPQASGKGTQADMLAKRYSTPHISTGNIFRENITAKTPLGELAASYINQGNLVPNEVTNKLIAKRLKEKDCQKGLVLDGYPRNIEQAKFLDQVIKIDKVIWIYLTDEEALFRISGRRSCECGQVYHLKFNPPKKSDVCDKCGQKLFVRDDETEEAIQKRLAIFHQETEPLKNYYRQKGILLEINGKPPIKEVSEDIISKLEA